MKRTGRKSTKQQTSRYRTSKYSPNVYDISVITAIAILVVTVTYVSVGQIDPQAANTVGQAYASLGDMVCVKNDYGDIVCASGGQLAKVDANIFSNCINEYGCTLSCTQLTNACTDEKSLSACALQNKFC